MQHRSSIVVPVVVFGLVAAISGPGSGHAAAGIIDSINPDASPLPRTVYAPHDIGWYYTPAFDYKLEGIFSFFEPIPNGTGDHTITVQIQTDRPANGGTLLAEASFPGNSFIGGRLGADFISPISLTAGHSYFVDFLNVGGMGTDFGQFAIASDGTHVPAAGATTRLGAYYTDPPGSNSFITEFAGNAGDRTLPTGNGSALEPILYFDGSTGGGTTAVTPEPSTAVLMLMGLGGAFALRRRSRRKEANIDRLASSDAMETGAASN